MIDGNLNLETRQPILVKLDVSNNVLLGLGLIAIGLITWGKTK